MKLESLDGQKIELHVAGYEFPEANNSADGNWLNINAKIDCKLGKWEFTEPILEVVEAQILGRWLEAVADGLIRPSWSDAKNDAIVVFIEPNMSFRLVRRYKNSSTLGIYFSLESLPPWVVKDSDGIYPEIVVELEVSNEAIKLASQEWLKELLNFPVRGESA